MGIEPLPDSEAERRQRSGQSEARARGARRWLFRWGLLPWVLYLLLIAGGVALTPRILTWALDTPYPVATVSGSSMWPTLKKGDLVILKGVGGLDDLQVGDIISIRHENGLAIHRIVSIEGEKIVTKGDANSTTDQPIYIEQVVGKVVSVGGHLVKVPLVGHLSALFGPLMGPATNLFRNDTDGETDFASPRLIPIEESERPIGSSPINQGKVLGPVRDRANDESSTSSAPDGTPLGSLPDLSKQEEAATSSEPYGTPLGILPDLSKQEGATSSTPEGTPLGTLPDLSKQEGDASQEPPDSPAPLEGLSQ